MRGNLQDPLNAQGYRTQRPEMPEDLNQPLYDRVHYPAAGSNELPFFSNPRGTSVTLIQAGAATTVSKSYRDTNMENSGVVPSKMHKISGISIGFVHEDEGEPANPHDREKIRSGGYLQLRIIDKDILIVPLIMIPELNPNVIGATTATTTTIIGNAGGGGLGAKMYQFSIPITLNPNENFSVKMNFTGTVTTTKAVDIYCFLHSIMRRPS